MMNKDTGGMREGKKQLPRISVGYRVGMLTVVEKTEERKYNYVIWKCQCDCGNTIHLDTRYLQRGAVKDCGCLSNKDILIGQRFGQLTCLEQMEEKNEKNHIMWRCRCDCGNECIVEETQLLYRNKKSCGCLAHPPLKQYVGKVFGELTVVEYAGKKQGMHRWKCQCTCGNETIVGQSLLQDGRTKSCGCLKVKNLKEKLKLSDGTSITKLESSKNMKAKNNKSGYTGVYKNKKTNRWYAQITFKKKTYYLGSFERYEEAVDARKRAEFVHKNYIKWYYENLAEDNLEKGRTKEASAIALSSATSALHIAVKLAGVNFGDIVFCSDMTSVATVNPIIYEGGVPVFIDSERETWNMDPRALEKAFEKYPDTKVVVLVHQYGIPAKMDEILTICEKHRAILIEDAAEALAATYKGKSCGTFGNSGILSFNESKMIMPAGGGILITKTKEERQKAMLWAAKANENAGCYQIKESAYDFDASNAASGVYGEQMNYLQANKNLKERIYKKYKKAFENLPIKMNPFLAESKPSFTSSCIIFDEDVPIDIERVIQKMQAENIACRPLWKPMHLHTKFEMFECVMLEHESVSEDIFKRGLCLPSNISITEEEQDKVIEMIRGLKITEKI